MWDAKVSTRPFHRQCYILDRNSSKTHSEGGSPHARVDRSQSLQKLIVEISLEI